MLKISRLPLVAACFAMVVATIAGAQNSSTTESSAQPAASTQSSGTSADTSSSQPSATNPSNLPATESGTTEQQNKAPVVDPQASATEAANAKADAAQSSQGQATSSATADSQKSATQDWPAPQRYEAGRGSGDSSSARDRANLGVNIVRSEDGQGIFVVRIRPGTPAERMGLRPRDRILSLNGQPVASADEFISAIRGMNPGDQVELSIDRNGNASDIRGKLDALRESIAEGEGPVSNIVGRAGEIIGRDRSGRIGEGYRTGSENMQTSYEDGSQSSRPSGDWEARLSRVEQQINQLMRDVSEIRTSLRSNPATSPALPDASAAGQPSTRGPSAFRATPGQPPSGLQPQSR